MTLLINYCSKKTILQKDNNPNSCYDLYLINKYPNITTHDYPPSLSYIQKITTHTDEHYTTKYSFFRFQPLPHP